MAEAHLSDFPFPLHLIALQLGIVGTATIEQGRGSGRFAVLDGHIILGAIEIYKHLGAARDEGAFLIFSTIVDKIAVVIRIVEIEIALLIDALGIVGIRGVTNHANGTTGEADIVLTVSQDIVVQP